jgi:hypothetical protein
MDKNKTNWVMDLIGKLGFPIVVTGWLLYERSTTLQTLVEAINNNTAAIQQILHK